MKGKIMIGELSETTRGRLEWRIPKFSSVSRTDILYYSPSLIFMNRSLNLLMCHPNIYDYLYVYLDYENEYLCDANATVSFSIKKSDGTLFGTKVASSLKPSINLFLEGYVLRNKKFKLLPQDTLTLVCDLNFESDEKESPLLAEAETDSVKEKAEIEVSEHMELTGLAAVPQDTLTTVCDMEIELGEKELPLSSEAEMKIVKKKAEREMMKNHERKMKKKAEGEMMKNHEREIKMKAEREMMKNHEREMKKAEREMRKNEREMKKAEREMMKNHEREMKEKAVIEFSEHMELTETDLLSQNLKDLLSNQDSCDAVLLVQDKEFKVHKFILIARSPVFAAMFRHDTTEKESGKVVISDCDPNSFQKFLEYLYCGRLEDLSSDSALDLYYTSDKYDLQELKAFCIKYLMHNLTLQNVCDVVSLADKYDEISLLSAVQDFFNRNLQEILTTSEWMNLLKKDFRLANKLLVAMSKTKK